MNKQDFLIALREAVKGKKRAIYFGPGSGGLRIVGEDGDWMCPLTAVATAQLGGRWNVDMARKAGEDLGLSEADTRAIIASADWGLDRPYQIQMLHACGFHHQKQTGPNEPVVVGETIERKKLQHVRGG